MFNVILDKAKSKITRKPLTQVQLERIGIKSEVKDIGLKVDGTTKTGLDIDEALENNLGRTFKTYDNYDKATKTAISVKSIDMTSKTYIDGSGLNNTLNKYERAMKNFVQFFEKTLTPYPASALIGASSSSQMLVGNGVVSKVGQVQNNRLALENTLIWNKITPVYPDISPTFIPRVFITESAGKILY